MLVELKLMQTPLWLSGINTDDLNIDGGHDLINLGAEGVNLLEKER